MPTACVCLLSEAHFQCQTSECRNVLNQLLFVNTLLHIKTDVIQKYSVRNVDFLASEFDLESKRE